jgi:hypothetical protein
MYNGGAVNMAGNLGGYQMLTTVAKKFHGPVGLVAAIAVGGYVILSSAKSGIIKVSKKAKRQSYMPFVKQQKKH